MQFLPAVNWMQTFLSAIAAVVAGKSAGRNHARRGEEIPREEDLTTERVVAWSAATNVLQTVRLAYSKEGWKKLVRDARNLYCFFLYQISPKKITNSCTTSRWRFGSDDLKGCSWDDRWWTKRDLQL